MLAPVCPRAVSAAVRDLLGPAQSLQGQLYEALGAETFVAGGGAMKAREEPEGPLSAGRGGGGTVLSPLESVVHQPTQRPRRNVLRGGEKFNSLGLQGITHT